MANREKGEIEVKVGDKAYTLRPTFDSICELEDLTGKSIDTLFRSIEKGSFSGLRAMVWCMLQDEHGDEIRTLKDASKWITAAGGPDVLIVHLAKLRDLNEDEQPEGDAAAARPHLARAGTGTRSSSRRAKSA